MEQPIRIQRKRTKGWRMPENTVYVGRPTKWGNPFKVGDKYEQPDCTEIVLNRQQACNLYEQSVFYFNTPISRAEIKEQLKGKNLACWCPVGQPCHADILLEIANQ